MNCDRVFDVLTRGPFPSGDPEDGSVELHLQACHGCRCLAEALQPAVDLFREAIGPEEASRLPGYTGVLVNPSATRTAHVGGATTVLKAVRPAARWWTAQSRTWNWVFPVGLLCGVVVLAAVNLTGDRSMPGAEGRGPALWLVATALSADQVSSLERLDHADDCLPPGFAGRTEYQCCTHCHSASARQRSRVTSVSPLLAACSICHR